jgi:hypothetical protein
MNKIINHFNYCFMKRSFLLFLAFGVMSLYSCKRDGLPGLDWNPKGGHDSSPTKHASADVATDWYNLQLRILLERNSALNGVHFAYIGVGLYESVRHGIKNSVSLSTKLNQMPEMPSKENNNGYNWQVSANAAMASMVRQFFQGLTDANKASIDSLENAYNQKTSLSASTVFSRSQTFGRRIADAVYKWYLTDNLNGTNTGYVLPPTAPGGWVPTPPAFVPLPVNPFLGTARTFLAANGTTVAPPFPATYSENANSDFYKIVKHVYDISTTLTQEQKNIALYYVDQGNGLGYTPPGHDFSALTQAIEQRGQDLGTAAEAYAKAGIAERDASIICFRSKYQYHMVRPITYIRKLIDPNWLSFIPTPPHPEYPAAHALITSAVMQAAARVLGDNVSFTDHSYDFRGYPSRSFKSLFAAGEEAGISRLYGGIHYLPSINAGLALAKDIGNKIGDIKLHD